MKGDVVILLDKLKDALLRFTEELDLEKDTDIHYGHYLKDLLIHTANNYHKLTKDLTSYLKMPYKTLYAMLPGNVPMVFFEVLPLSIIYNIKTFFKYPRVEKTLYAKFLQYLSLNYPRLKTYYKGAYLPHNEAEKRISRFDFVFFFGSEKLIPLLKRTKTPFRFFGPGFSIGIALQDVYEDFIKDVLYFDQRGCLSMKFLFYTNDTIKQHVIDITKKHADRIPTTSIFSQDRFTYRILFASSYMDVLLKHKNTAILETKDDVFRDIPLPDRTLILKKIKREEDIIRFLGKKIANLQAIATDNSTKLRLLKEKASFITYFGRLQFEPYNFFFKKGVTLKNIFQEVENDYQMAKNL